MCGREKGKDKSSSIICHLLAAVVEKDNMWGREKGKDKSSSIICHLLPAVAEKDNVWERNIKTRVAQLFVTYSLQW